MSGLKGFFSSLLNDTSSENGPSKSLLSATEQACPAYLTTWQQMKRRWDIRNPGKAYPCPKPGDGMNPDGVVPSKATASLREADKKAEHMRTLMFTGAVIPAQSLAAPVAGLHGHTRDEDIFPSGGVESEDNVTLQGYAGASDGQHSANW